MLDVNAFYFDTEGVRNNSSNTGTYKTNSQYLFYGLGLCYKTGEFCFGAKYIKGDLGSKLTDDPTDSSLEYQATGLGAGYIGQEFFAQIHYLFDGKKESKASTGGLSYPVAEGWMVDLAYGFPVGGLMIGPMLKWVEFRYDKVESNGQSQSLNKQESDTFTMPMFSLWTFF